MFDLAKISLAAFAAAMIGGSASAATVLIDDFTDSQFVETDIISSPVTDTVAGSMIGGFRTVEVSNTEPSPAIPGLNTDVTVSGGVFAFNNDALAQGAATVTYNANGAGLGGIDLTDGGSNTRFLFLDVTADIGLDFEMTVVDGDSSDTVSGTFTESFTGQDETVLFSSFTGIDFSNVESVSFSLMSGTAFSQDFSTSLVAAVPVPAAGFLLLGGLGGLAAMRRRRKKS